MHPDELDPERVARVAGALAAPDGGSEASLCASSASIARVDGAGVVLVMHGLALGTVCSSDPIAEAVEEVQYTLGEGPCIDAFTTCRPVLVPDLAAHGADHWSGFREGALAAGVRAVFGFPILVGPVCIGALDLYQLRSGPLDDEQLADAAAVAHVAGRTILGWQSIAGSGSLARELEHLPVNRAVVHQATGMVSVQASVSVDDAVVLLRAHAFAHDRPIAELASDVVRGELRFD